MNCALSFGVVMLVARYVRKFASVSDASDVTENLSDEVHTSIPTKMT